MQYQPLAKIVLQSLISYPIDQTIAEIGNELGLETFGEMIGFELSNHLERVLDSAIIPITEDYEVYKPFIFGPEQLLAAICFGRKPVVKDNGWVGFVFDANIEEEAQGKVADSVAELISEIESDDPEYIEDIPHCLRLRRHLCQRYLAEHAVDH